MTSNIGSQWITDLGSNEYEELKKRVLDAVKMHFKPEFINRIDEIIIFRSLSVENIKEIIKLQLAYLTKRAEERGVKLTYSDALKDYIAKEGYDPVYGASALKRLIQKTPG